MKRIEKLRKKNEEQRNKIREYSMEPLKSKLS